MKRKMLLIAALALLVAIAIAWPAGSPVYAQNGNVWHVEYFPNTSWGGAPVFAQDVAFLNLNWNGGSPGPGLPATNFTARMTSVAPFNAGVYRFSLLADDELLLWIDGTLLVDTRGQGLVGQTYFVDVAMTQGAHRFQVNYRQYTSASYINVNWSALPGPLPAGRPVTLPITGGGTPTPLPPPSATSVVTQYGDYTRCIQQGLHQANCFVPPASNSPNLGSIQMEPQIRFWGNCTADTTRTFPTGPDATDENYKCSKTDAGWFRG